MFDPLGVQLEMVVIVGEEHTAFGVGMCELNRVGGTEEPDLLGSRHVDAPATEALGNRRVHVLVKMKANRPRHPLPRAS